MRNLITVSEIELKEAKMTLNGNYLVQLHGHDVYVDERGNLLNVDILDDQWEYLSNVTAEVTYFNSLPSRDEVVDMFNEWQDNTIEDSHEYSEWVKGGIATTTVTQYYSGRIEKTTSFEPRFTPRLPEDTVNKLKELGLLAIYKGINKTYGTTHESKTYTVNLTVRETGEWVYSNVRAQRFYITESIAYSNVRLENRMNPSYYHSNMWEIVPMDDLTNKEFYLLADQF
jgi:hypothetical protein